MLEAVKAREPYAWQRFDDLYRPLVRYWCTKASLQWSDAEDVAQEVFEALALAIDRFHHDRCGDTFRGWLRTITRNAVANHHRRALRTPTAPGGTSAMEWIQSVPDRTNDEPNADSEERRLVLQQAFRLTLDRFRDHTREAFLRVVVDRQSPEHVAEDLGIKLHSVYLAKSRVLARLREEFGELIELDRELNAVDVADKPSNESGGTEK